MITNATQFAFDVQAFVDKAQSKLEMIRKEATKELFKRIILGTPVGGIEYMDEELIGIARGGWNISLNDPDFSTNGTQDKGGESILNSKFSIIDKASPSDTIYLSNGVEYIGVLEYGRYPSPVKLGGGSYNRVTGEYVVLSSNGFSMKAPNGMVRTNTKFWEGIVQTVIRRMDK